MSKPFEGLPNENALEQQAKKNVQEAIDLVLSDKNIINGAIAKFEEEMEDSSDPAEARYKMWSFIEERVIVELLKAHDVELNDTEMAELANDDEDPLDRNVIDQDLAEQKDSLSKKKELMEKIGNEYSSIDMPSMLQEAVGADGSDEDVETLRNY